MRNLVNYKKIKAVLLKHMNNAVSELAESEGIENPWWPEDAQVRLAEIASQVIQLMIESEGARE